MLYNFVHQGTVYFYQSGFRYEEDNRLKPGHVTHALVIQACLDRGLDSYDFLASQASGSRYKQSLATDTRRLAWTVLRRPTVRTHLVSALRRLKRLVRPPQDMRASPDVRIVPSPAAPMSPEDLAVRKLETLCGSKGLNRFGSNARLPAASATFVFGGSIRPNQGHSDPLRHRFRTKP